MTKDLDTANTIFENIVSLDTEALNRWKAQSFFGNLKPLTIYQFKHGRRTGIIFRDFGYQGWIRMDVKDDRKLYIGLSENKRHDIALIRVIHEDNKRPLSSEYIESVTDVYWWDLSVGIINNMICYGEPKKTTMTAASPRAMATSNI
ncbi:hypothetical protein KKI24_23770 [bacterium]|nr:hypothetical protein [bacterium]